MNKEEHKYNLNHYFQIFESLRVFIQLVNVHSNALRCDAIKSKLKNWHRSIVSIVLQWNETIDAKLNNREAVHIIISHQIPVPVYFNYSRTSMSYTSITILEKLKFFHPPSDAFHQLD